MFTLTHTRRIPLASCHYEFKMTVPILKLSVLAAIGPAAFDSKQSQSTDGTNVGKANDRRDANPCNEDDAQGTGLESVGCGLGPTKYFFT